MEGLTRVFYLPLDKQQNSEEIMKKADMWCFFTGNGQLFKLVSLFIKKPQTGIHDISVVAHPPVIGNFLERPVHAERRAVRSVGGHGLDNISHSENPCLQKDIIAP
jgi:hypothetical protein